MHRRGVYVDLRGTARISTNIGTDTFAAMLSIALVSSAALAMPHTSTEANVTHGAPEYMGAGAFAADFEGITFGAKLSATGGTPMQLHMMADKGLKGAGAVCLDGSDAGFYFAPATNAKNKNDWQLYFQGGGWYVPHDPRQTCWLLQLTPFRRMQVLRRNGLLGSLQLRARQQRQVGKDELDGRRDER